MPSVDDLTFRILAERLDPPIPTYVDRALWLRENLPRLFPKEFGPHHLWLIDSIGNHPQGVRAFAGAPRGSGKSTVANVGLPLSCIAQGSHRFVVIIKESQRKAWGALRIIRRELDRNRHLTQLWPSLNYAETGGRRSLDQAAEIELRGGRIMALGAGESARGLLRETQTGELIRPDLVLLDDLETAEQVRSRERTDRLEEWLFADIAGLMGPGEEASMDILGTGTTLGMDALAVRAFSGKGRFSGWKTAKFPAESWINGERVALWKAQPISFLDRLQTEGDEMFLGSATYATEYLLDPVDRGDSIFQESWLKFGKSPDWEDLRYIVSGIDPAASQRTTADYSASVWCGLDKDNRVWVKRAWRQRETARALMDRIEADAIAGPGKRNCFAAFEAVGGFAWGVQMLRDKGLATRPIKPNSDKVSRATPTSVRMEGGSIWLDESLKDSEFVRELLSFPTADHDDMVDAFVMAERACTSDGVRIKRGAA